MSIPHLHYRNFIWLIRGSADPSTRPISEALSRMGTQQSPSALPAAAPETGLHVAIVGFGSIGRMHARILHSLSVRISIVDPQPVDVPDVDVWSTIDEIPDRIKDTIDVWLISNPTVHHLATLRTVLASRQAARVLLEKPACTSYEIDELQTLLNLHSQARIAINHQYRYSQVVSLMRTEMAQIGGGLPDSIDIAFTKDRRTDMAAGRFIDTDYEVLGYEWRHMLSVLEALLPNDVNDAYFTAPVEASVYQATRDRSGYLTAVRELSWLGSTRLSMYTTITEDLSGQGAPPQSFDSWRRYESSPARHRYAVVRFGDIELTAEFDPVTTIDGFCLPRNKHRFTIESRGRIVSDRVVVDSPLATSLRVALAQLTGKAAAPSLMPLKRMADIARHLRSQPSNTDSVASGQPVLSASLNDPAA
jgi:DNA-binding CsgD family transcriptional regulator